MYRYEQDTITWCESLTEAELLMLSPGSLAAMRRAMLADLRDCLCNGLRDQPEDRADLEPSGYTACLSFFQASCRLPEVDLAEESVAC